jgi:tRNA threonylcarbamoyladenosine biosynthesis protein TsaB
MLILSLDTTTSAGSHALAEDGKVLVQELGDPDRPQAARLPRDLKDMIERAGLTLVEIDLFAVATGPGSFTGLRIGIATMQGLSLATGRPLIGVSALDALATVAAPMVPTGGRLATWVDAWRGEVYAALYEKGNEAGSPTVERPERLLEDLTGRPTLFVGSGAATYENLIRGTLGSDAQIAEPAAPALAGAIAWLAANRARAGECPQPHSIRPLYVRRPDAELARQARRTTGADDRRAGRG